MTQSHQLRVHEIKKNYEGKPLLNGVSFVVNSGEVLCLLGRSGSGKSTLLRIIAGIEDTDSGSVFWDGEDLRDTPTHLRHFGLMFQDYALFPHRNVAENVAFGLRMQRMPKEEIDQQVQAALAKVKMSSFANRSVTDLSGGEQQRVALARALAPEPRLLMLDEPLAALDRTLREQLQGELRQLLHQSGIPAIYVTHDQEEALVLGDRMALLNEGKIVQNDEPEKLYRFPKNRWVAEFLGMQNFIEGQVVELSPLQIKTSVGLFQASVGPGVQFGLLESVTVVVTPAADFSSPFNANENHLSGVCVECLFKGNQYQVQLRLFSGEYFTYLSNHAIRKEEKITLWLPVQNVICLKK
ncbi:MAG: ABC transporter ATP-binding protein [Anaerolineaceae bacterium]